MTFDQSLTTFIQNPAYKFLSPLMEFIAYWGMEDMMIISVLVIFLLFFFSSYKREAYFSLTVFLADIVNIILKVLINRQRPEEIKIFPSFQQASFPSGHVVHYVVFFGFILGVMLVNKRIPIIIRWIAGILSGFLILGVGISRVYFGTHWPTDVVWAYLIGFIMLYFIFRLYHKPFASC